MQYTTCNSCSVVPNPTISSPTWFFPWAVIANYDNDKARTITIEVKDGVVCAVVPGPIEMSRQPRSFTLTCITKDVK